MSTNPGLRPIQKNQKYAEYNTIEIPMPPSAQLIVMLELLMEDLNLLEEKKVVLRKLSDERKWIMLQQHLSERYRDSTAREVNREIMEISRLKVSAEKDLLKNFVVNLRTRPIHWIMNFVDNGGLAALLDNLATLEEQNR